MMNPPVARLGRALPAKSWTFDNCPDHHYRSMGMCPYCKDTLESARARNGEVAK